MKITKSDPPSRFKFDWDPLIAAAKASPNEWVTTDKDYPHSVATLLQRGRHSLFPKGQYEIATSNNHYDIEGKRWCALHIRYTGQTGSQEEGSA